MALIANKVQSFNTGLSPLSGTYSNPSTKVLIRPTRSTVTAEISENAAVVPALLFSASRIPATETSGNTSANTAANTLIVPPRLSGGSRKSPKETSANTSANTSIVPALSFSAANKAFRKIQENIPIVSINDDVLTPRELISNLIRDKLAAHKLHLDPETALWIALEYNASRTPPYSGRIVRKESLVDVVLNKSFSHASTTPADVEVTADYTPLAVAGGLGALGANGTRQSISVYRHDRPDGIYDSMGRVDMPSTEIAVILQTIDPEQEYKKYLDGFWQRTPPEKYVDLIRDELFAAAVHQSDDHSLSMSAQKLVLSVLGLKWSADWSDISTGRSTMETAPGSASIVTGHIELQRGGELDLRSKKKYISPTLMYMRDMVSKKVVLFIPGNSSPLHTFNNVNEMKEWMGRQLADKTKQLVIAEHFSSQDRSNGAQKLLENIGAAPLNARKIWLPVHGTRHAWVPRVMRPWSPILHISLAPAANNNIFLSSANKIKDRSYSDGAHQITTTVDLIKKLLIGLVNVASITLAAPLLFPFFPGAGLAAAVLFAGGLIQVGVGIDDVVKGKPGGVGNIVYGLLNALPIATVAAGKISHALSQQLDKVVIKGAIYYISHVKSRHTGNLLARQFEVFHPDKTTRLLEKSSKILDVTNPSHIVLGVSPSSLEVLLSHYAVQNVGPPALANMPRNGVFTGKGAPYRGGNESAYILGNDHRVYQVKNVRSAYRAGTGYASVDIVDPNNPHGLATGRLYRAPGDQGWRMQSQIGLCGGGPCLSRQKPPSPPDAKTTLNKVINGATSKEVLTKPEFDEVIEKLTQLIKESNAEDLPSIASYNHAGSDIVNEPLRAGLSTRSLKEFLTEFNVLIPYFGPAYRSAYVTSQGAQNLRNSAGKVFMDLGVQSSSALPFHMYEWEVTWAASVAKGASQKVFYIFDSNIPKKNLSTGFLADHIAIPPSTRLKVEAIEDRGDALYVYLGHVVEEASSRKVYNLFDGTELIQTPASVPVQIEKRAHSALPPALLSTYAAKTVSTPRVMPENGVFTKNGDPYREAGEAAYILGNDGHVYQVNNIRSAQQNRTGYDSADVVDQDDPEGAPKGRLYRAKDEPHWLTRNEIKWSIPKNSPSSLLSLSSSSSTVQTLHIDEEEWELSDVIAMNDHEKTGRTSQATLLTHDVRTHLQQHLRHSNVKYKGAIADYLHSSLDGVNDALRAENLTPALDEFLMEFNALAPFHGSAYRPGMITPEGADRLRAGTGELFIDQGVQSASIIPHNIHDWKRKWPGDIVSANATQKVFYVFDATVPKRNMAVDLLTSDLVAIPPGTTLKVREVKEKEGVLYVYLGDADASASSGRVYNLFDGTEATTTHFSACAVEGVASPETMPENAVFTRSGDSYRGQDAAAYVLGENGNVYQVTNIRSARQNGMRYDSADVVDPANLAGTAKAALYRIPDTSRWITQKELILSTHQLHRPSELDARAMLDLVISNAKIHDGLSKSESERQDFTCQLEQNLKRSNVGNRTRIRQYIEEGPDSVNRHLRGQLQTPNSKEFYSEFVSLNRYFGYATRTTKVTSRTVDLLKKGIGKMFVDKGVQSASILPAGMHALARSLPKEAVPNGATKTVVYVFDPSVPKKNLAVDKSRDHVVIPPQTVLEVVAIAESHNVLYVYFDGTGARPSTANIQDLFDDTTSSHSGSDVAPPIMGGPQPVEDLERELKELRRPNDKRKPTSAFFVQA